MIPLQKIRTAVAVNVHDGMIVQAHDGCGTVLADPFIDGTGDCFPLGFRRHRAEHGLRLCQRGDGEGQGVGGYVFQFREASVVNLLHPADLIQRHFLNHAVVIELCDPRVVEGDMPVFPDAQAHDIRGIFFQQCGVSGISYENGICSLLPL